MNSSRVFYDQRETRGADDRAAWLAQALPRQVAHAQRAAPHFRQILAPHDAGSITGVAALSRLPVTRKSDVAAMQDAAPPFGGLAAIPRGGARRLFLSPGPIWEPEGQARDYFRYGRALFAAGIRAGDVVHNCAGYHFTPLGAIYESAAHAVGAAVIPAGPGNTEMQAQAIARMHPDAYTGTPDYLKTILEKGDELGLDLSSVRIAHVSGGAYLPVHRTAYEARKIAVFQAYGTAELGLVAFESPAREGLICDEDVVTEIVRPGTGDAVPDGEVGEVVCTLLTPEYPLIRFATGDLSAILPGESPCGRTNRRIRGWLGRADQTTKVKGVFVTPAQVAQVIARVPGVGRARLVVGSRDGADTMTLRAEAPEEAAPMLEQALQVVTKLRGVVACVAPGTLPNDGKVIEDARTYA